MARTTPSDSHRQSEVGGEASHPKSAKAARGEKRKLSEGDKLCQICGKAFHPTDSCWFKDHPERNQENKPFATSTMGVRWKAMIADDSPVAMSFRKLDGSARTRSGHAKGIRSLTTVSAIVPSVTLKTLLLIALVP